MTIFQKVMRIKNRVIFRKEHKVYGSINVPDDGGKSKDPIKINIGLHERKIPSRTYLHECLHIIYPKMSERQIRATEEMVWNTLTPHQRFLLAKKLYNRKWRTR